MQYLSDYQRKKLLENPNVNRITDKHILYTSKFKVKAVELHSKGQSANDIFSDAGLSPKLFIKKYCQSCIKRWKKKYNEEGKESLKVSMTGTKSTGKPKSKNTDDLTIEELRAIVEIQEEVITMLKKTRTLAKKKE